jgi:hypothetical protein
VCDGGLIRWSYSGPFRGGPFRGGPFRGGPFRGGPFRGGPFRGGPGGWPEGESGKPHRWPIDVVAEMGPNDNEASSMLSSQHR